MVLMVALVCAVVHGTLEFRWRRRDILFQKQARALVLNPRSISLNTLSEHAETHPQAGETIDNRASGDCVTCMDLGAAVVATQCGHTVCCVRCRRKFVHQTLVQDGHCANTSAAKKELSTKQLERIKVPCPICRSLSTLTIQHKFHGTVLNVAGHSISLRRPG